MAGTSGRRRRQHPTERVKLGELKPHPRNYRAHPEEQVEHIVASIEEHGFYRNIVVARDGTILAGHGVVEAARKAGLREVPVIRLPLDADSPAALKVLTGDNELGRTAEIDDRLLSELLLEVKDLDSLLGTGYDEMMLANLVYVTRGADEIESHDAAAHWVGLPGWDAGDPYPFKLIISFETEEERAAFYAERFGDTRTTKSERRAWVLRWPPTDREDLVSLKWEDTEAEPVEAT